MEILILIVPVLFFTTNTLKLAKDICDNMIFPLEKPDAFSENCMFPENHGATKMTHLVILY